MQNTLTIMISFLFVTSAFAADPGNDFVSRWDYPHNSAGGAGESSGSVSYSRSARRTSDPVEKVVLWYTKRLGLPEDHALVEAAESGFSDLDSRLNIRSAIGNDTEDKQDHVVTLGTITAEHAHVTMVYQPSLTEKKDVVISITQTPAGTNIHVLRQEP